MSKNNNPENETPRSNKRRKKHFSPYKKDKYTLSKLREYQNYINNIELMSRGGGLELD